MYYFYFRYIAGFVSSKDLEGMLSQFGTTAIIGFRFPNHTLGGVSVMGYFMNPKTGQFQWRCLDPFENKVHMENKRSLIELIFSTKELAGASFILQQDLQNPGYIRCVNKYALFEISGDLRSFCQLSELEENYMPFTLENNSRYCSVKLYCYFLNIHLCFSIFSSIKNQITNNLQRRVVMNELPMNQSDASSSQIESNGNEVDFAEIPTDSQMESSETLENSLEINQLYFKSI